METTLDDDIRAKVEESISTGGLLDIAHLSKRLTAAHPESGLARAAVAELLLKAGVSARVTIELDGLRS